MAVPPPTKEALRKELRTRRRDHVAGLSLAQRCAAATHLREHVLPLLADEQPVAVYLPLADEIDPLPIIAALDARDIHLALPHFVSSAKPARFLAWRPGDALFEGPMGLRQPAPEAAEVAPAAFLAPLLGFDGALTRLGYGAGFYDRAFATWPNARRIGLAWACQRVDAIPRDAWDLPLHAVATEAGMVG